MSETRRRLAVIIVMVIMISILHYVTSTRFEADQVIYAKLYFIPVALAALTYGLRGGLLAACVISLVYGPSLLFQKVGPRALLLDFTLDLALLFAIGMIVGIVVDRERQHHRRARRAERLASLGKAAAMMAHEMKSPLVAIGGFARILLRQDDLERESRDSLEVIKMESARLERLVHDALDFARFQPVRVECVRVGDLLEQTRRVVGQLAATKGVNLIETCTVPQSKLRCDPGRITQVLINLIDNAIHFTPPGGAVQISLRATRTGTVRIEIRDSGRGVPKDMLKHLFEPFAGRRNGGSGLGLAIAQRIIQAHGGHIDAENLPDGGASFRFDLPLYVKPPATGVSARV
jgi:two-component system sensor histidine kinase HydH